MWTKIITAFRTNILIGLFLLAPLVGTLLVINIVTVFISRQLLPAQWLESSYALLYRLAALAMVVAALYFVGLFTRNFFGRKIYSLADWVLTHIPVISSVYTSIRQISESLVSTQSTLFKDVVVVQFPRPGMYAIGFITARVPEIIARKITAGRAADGDGDMICLFVPTAPNPTSGFFLMMPRSEITYLNISVAAAMKMVISSGAASPWRNETESRLTLLDHIEAWLQRGAAKPSPPEPPAADKPA
ncbi:MAG: DUF502 domain-containing protein [Kiritimatiellae bacterium]|jgi:uncharacterized membrane protein|nr:DUF502 domain-containing protein [Kiritimatiellia bacterium]